MSLLSSEPSQMTPLRHTNTLSGTFREFHGSGKHQGCEFSHTEASGGDTALNNLQRQMQNVRPVLGTQPSSALESWPGLREPGWAGLGLQR